MEKQPPSVQHTSGQLAPPPAYVMGTYNVPPSYGDQTRPSQPTSEGYPAETTPLHPGYAVGAGPPPGVYPVGTAPPPGYVAGPPPPHGTYVVGAPMTTVVVTNQPSHMIRTKFPSTVVCQYCHATVTTTPHAEVGLTTWAVAGICVLFGFWLGCCLIPFCVDDCKDIYHECPNCKKTIGVYKHM